MTNLDSVFGDIDFSEIPDDPFAVPANSYVAFLSEAAIRATKDGNAHGLSLTFTIADGDYRGSRVQDWKNIPNIADPHNLTTDERRALAFLKKRYMDLGVDEADIRSVNPADLVGTRCVIRVTNTERGGVKYTNVADVQVVDDEYELDD